MNTHPHGEPYPHEGACAGCRDELRCNHCGADIRHDFGRCTNGRCTKCHDKICGTGGATAPGHSFFRH